MKYVSVENIIFVCVIAGMLTVFAGLCYHSGAAIFIGIFVGGIIPVVAAGMEA